MVMYDSLNRHMLPNYGCDWTVAPNFRRLQKKSVTFDTMFVGSMPCMPARRELHTARYNFLPPKKFAALRAAFYYKCKIFKDVLTRELAAGGFLGCFNLHF